MKKKIQQVQEVKETELQKRPKDDDPAALISAAIAKGADLKDVEKLLELRERFEANEAKKAYFRAMAAFKENPPKIVKDKKVNYKTEKGTVNYRHASLFGAVERITAELSKHGLSVSWGTQQAELRIGVTTKITHVLGFSQETTLFASADNSGSKNAIQAIGSTVSYLQRYGLFAILGLAARDMDDDGASSQVVEYVDEKQIAIIEEYISSTKADRKAVLDYMGVESVDLIPKSQYQKVINAFKVKESKK